MSTPSWQQRLRDATSQAVFLRTEQPFVFIAHSLLADPPAAAKEAETTAEYVARHRLQETLEDAITSLHPSSMDDPRIEMDIGAVTGLQTRRWPFVNVHRPACNAIV